MGIKASDTGGASFAPCPEGVMTAVCTRVVDLGTQYNAKWNKSSRKVLLQWEVSELINAPESEYHDQPYVISRQYTLSLNKKASLRKDLEAWRGRAFSEEELKGFDLINLLGKCCQLQIVHTKDGDKVYANINAVMSLPRGMSGPDPFQTPIYYSIEDHSIEVPEVLPEWIQEKIAESSEFKALLNVGSGDENVPEEDSGDIPF